MESDINLSKPNESINPKDFKITQIFLAISADQGRWLAICKADKKREGQGREGGREGERGCKLIYL